MTNCRDISATNLLGSRHVVLQIHLLTGYGTGSPAFRSWPTGPFQKRDTRAGTGLSWFINPLIVYIYIYHDISTPSPDYSRNQLSKTLGSHRSSQQQLHLAQIHLGCDGLEDQPLLALRAGMRKKETHRVAEEQWVTQAKTLQYAEHPTWRL